MAYWFINKHKPETADLCATEEDARDKLDTFLQTCRDRGYQVEEHHEFGAEYPSFLVHDQAGSPVGDYTISSEAP